MNVVTIEELHAHLKRNDRLLGLDIGTKRTGIAISDRSRFVATPVEIMVKTKFTADAQKLKAYCAKEGVAAIVIGLPRNMDGSEGPRCQSVRQFAENLGPILPLPIYFQDERMSTMAVERTLLEADMSRAKRAEVIDAVAAAYILQGALDTLRNLG